MHTDAPHTHPHLGDLTRQTTTRLGISLVLTLAFVVFEAAAGVFSNSLALLSDAGHNLTDVIALALSWYALRLSTQPANSRNTFGYHRAGILVALVNSTTLVLIALGIFYEAYRRLIAPVHVQADILVGVGVVALAVNAGTAWLVKRGSDRDLNLRSAFVHLMGDVIATVGAIVVGILIVLTGANWLDPLISVLIGILILWNAWGILRESVDILLESTPRDIDMSSVVRDLLAIKGVLGVHDLHVWSINHNLRTLSAHILTEDIAISSGFTIQTAVNDMLCEKYGIGHAILQLECSGCLPDVLYCDLNGENHSTSA